MASSAARRVFAVPELLENILLEVESDNPRWSYQPACVQLFTTQRVCRTFHDMIATSKSLQSRMRDITLIDEPDANGVELFETLDSPDRDIGNAYKSRNGHYRPPRGSSWRDIKIVHPDFVKFRIVKRVMIWDRSLCCPIYELFFDAESGHTTLGMLADWEDAVDSRTPEESLEAYELYLESGRAEQHEA